MRTGFTIFFEGDISKFAGNPFKADTPFGKPGTIGLGNAFEELDRLRDELEKRDHDHSVGMRSEDVS